MLEILEAGGLVTVQDAGRRGWQKFGVPVSGPMDWFAFRAANLLAGNSPDAAALESGFGDLTLRAQRDCVLAVTGAGFVASTFVWTFPLWTSFFVRGGWKITITKNDFRLSTASDDPSLRAVFAKQSHSTTERLLRRVGVSVRNERYSTTDPPRNDDALGYGNWAYLAVSGGIEVEPVLGSRSTNLRAKLGNKLQVGDALRFGKPSRSLDELAARTFSPEKQPAYSSSPLIEVIQGPQSDWFQQEGLDTFWNGEYEVSPSSDRMGYRLEGPSIAHLRGADLLSEGMTAGSVQIPANGQPIVMMADCPTTGGYPKIANVVKADLPLLAQVPPREGRIRFKMTTVEEAQSRVRTMMQDLEEGIEDSENDAKFAQ